MPSPQPHAKLQKRWCTSFGENRGQSNRICAILVRMFIEKYFVKLFYGNFVHVPYIEFADYYYIFFLQKGAIVGKWTKN